MVIHWPPLNDGSKSINGKALSPDQNDEIMRHVIATGEILLKDVFMIPQKEGICGRCQYLSCVVTVTEMLDLAIFVNIYIPCVCKNVGLEISCDKQKAVLNGRPVASYAPGVPRKVALNSVVRCLSLNSFDTTKWDQDIEAKFKPKVDWLEAYSTFSNGGF